MRSNIPSRDEWRRYANNDDMLAYLGVKRLPESEMARGIMRAVFGDAWGFQYPWEGDGQRVAEKHGMRRIDLYSGQEVTDGQS